MPEVTEIWIWTVWEELADAGDPATPGVDAAAAADTEVTSQAETGNDRTAGAEPPIAGYSVEASDGHIGTVDEVSYDAGTGAIVVDTGHWIFGKKRMVPAGMVAKIDNESRVVTLSCTKAQVKAAPDHDPARADDAGHRDEVAEHYNAQRDAEGSGSETGAAPA